MRYNRKGIVLVLAIAFAALLLPISTVHSASCRTLPFIEYATATASVLAPEKPPPGKSPPPANLLYIRVSGSGYATYLGKISVEQYHTVDTTTMTFYDGTYTDTAANGGTIFGSYHGYLVVLKNGDFEIHGIFTIDGGTGRFSNVIGGGGKAIGVQHPDNTAWLLLLGSICFD
jgi:hypothetical protein